MTENDMAVTYTEREVDKRTSEIDSLAVTGEF